MPRKGERRSSRIAMYAFLVLAAITGIICYFEYKFGLLFLLSDFVELYWVFLSFALADFLALFVFLFVAIVIYFARLDL
jgi:hypothetical protein